MIRRKGKGAAHPIDANTTTDEARAVHAEAPRPDVQPHHVDPIAKPSSQPQQAVGPIRAQLVGSSCTAASLTASRREPIFDLCRLLLAAGHDPSRPLHVYRGEAEAIEVRSIAAGARLTVEESGHGPVFRRFRTGPQGAVERPPMRSREPDAAIPTGSLRGGRFRYRQSLVRFIL
jgi:hypothetical protein